MTAKTKVAMGTRLDIAVAYVEDVKDKLAMNKFGPNAPLQGFSNLHFISLF